MHSCVCVSIGACTYVCVSVCAYDVCVCVWDPWCTWVKQMTPMSVWVSPRCGWCTGHVVQKRSGPHWLHRPGIISECGPEFALSEGTVHLLSAAGNASEVHGRSVLEQPPCRQNQVLSVWLGTPPSISPVHFPLPRIKSAQGNTSALPTCRQDKQSGMPKFCHVCLMCERSSDNVFITTCNWFSRYQRLLG